jgi:glycosyltransferase involved in cell wall biosynthesis
MGLPVASFSTGGIPEAVAHNATGFLTDERDTQGLARNIVTLLRDDALWHRFSNSAAERARELFDLQNQTRKLEKIYDRLLMQAEATQDNEFPLQPVSEEYVQHQYSIQPQARKHN